MSIKPLIQLWWSIVVGIWPLVEDACKCMLLIFVGLYSALGIAFVFFWLWSGCVNPYGTMRVDAKN